MPWLAASIAGNRSAPKYRFWVITFSLPPPLGTRAGEPRAWEPRRSVCRHRGSLRGTAPATSTAPTIAPAAIPALTIASANSELLTSGPSSRAR